MDGEELDQLTKADWGAFGAAMEAMNWDDPAQRDVIRPGVLDYLVSVVAGHLIEDIESEGAVERVSKRIQKNDSVLTNPPNMKKAKADRDKTGLYLFLVQRNTLAQVVALEERANEILTRRKKHLDDLAALLVEHGTVEGEMLITALGKAANPPAPPAPAP